MKNTTEIKKAKKNKVKREKKHKRTKQKRNKQKNNKKKITYPSLLISSKVTVWKIAEVTNRIILVVYDFHIAMLVNP